MNLISPSKDLILYYDNIFYSIRYLLTAKIKKATTAKDTPI